MSDWYAEQQKKVKARAKLLEAIKNGMMDRPTICELCKSSPPPVKVTTINQTTYFKSKIVAHHWRGYDYPLDVWFICHFCNTRLRGQDCHNGSMNKEQAIEYIKGE